MFSWTMRVWYLIQELLIPTLNNWKAALQHLTFSPKKQSKHKCIFGRAQSAIFVDLLTAWQMCAWVKFWMFCRCHSRQAGLRTRVHNKRYWPLKRRFRSSVFCGREELLLVLTLTFLTFKTFYIHVEPEQHKKKTNETWDTTRLFCK